MVDPDEARAALDASIEHWRWDNERALYADDARIGSAHCALCQLNRDFISDDSEEEGCGECPVRLHTNEDFCYGTPYDAVEKALRNWHNAEDDLRSVIGGESLLSYLRKGHPFIRRWRAREAFLLAARDERQFLESLREEDQ